MGERDVEQLFFSGTFSHRVDGKGRLTMPSTFRDQFAEGVVVRKGSDGSVELVPMPAWNLFLESLKQISKTDTRGQLWITRQLAAATSLELDKNGRIVLPLELRERFNDSQDEPVVLTGALDRVKIWTQSQWDDLVEEDMENLDGYIYEKYQI